jgi:hypothetical protein
VKKNLEEISKKILEVSKSLQKDDDKIAEHIHQNHENLVKIDEIQQFMDS